MAYDEHLADRIGTILERRQANFFEKKMFGGLCYMVEEKMCVGIVKNELMARVGPDAMEEAIQREHCRDMDFTGRPMKGYVFVNPEGIDRDEDLEFYVDLCLAFNPLAKASKKKKKKVE